MKMALGEDILFWLLPTSPVYSINYNEKVWTKAEIVAQYRLGELRETTKQKVDDSTR
jgi:hypothetical protein